ncbi:phage portal-like protein [Leptospira santarosai str. ST188]|uniref:phage portal protein n=1 Tax=Leptospira santarosai TaxID=28183 RepID=UPI0002BBDDBC|nr:phage portal protein [Leptospira santarosai]EMF91204.1 phage portal-like protein [Leptospira santarosai str. ST188]
MNKKNGRPRGINYERNIERKNRRTETQKQNIDSKIVNDRFYLLAKSFFNQINSEKIAGRNPVYSYDQLQQIRDGIQLRPTWRIPYQQLRNSAYGTSLISAIHTVRTEDLSKFARVSQKTGLWFRTENEEDTIDDELLLKMKQCGRFFEKMGDLTPGWQNRDHIGSVIEMMTRDTLTLDSVAFYLVYNSFGKLLEIRYLDPATIFPVDPEKGYCGDRGITFVQIIDDNIVETFSASEILWLHKNHISDVSMRGFGFSPLEACILDLVAVINSLKFNRDTFTRQHPQGFMSFQGDATQEVIESLQLQWQEMISGIDDSHRIPIIGTSAGEVRWTPLSIPNDMLFKELMQWCTSFVLMGHGMDQSELGLRLIGSQATFSEGNQVEKSKLSMTRANLSLLTYFESSFNRLKEFREDDFSGIVCEFSGKNPEDEKEKLGKNKDEVSNWKLIDEIRIEQDKPTIAETLSELYGVNEEDFKMAGAVILNPIFQQNLQMLQNSIQSNSNIDEDPNSEYEDNEFEENEEETQTDLVF